ncbi:MAG: 16S rRNA (guanine(527)-N(7))-methyltransferase RsmG [Candidatus Solibacter usitatus]|nr:16S rRNA (guanine(527)-N(7))-methyltransferase RsmG [Candidatus Solibacter usitatus]
MERHLDLVLRWNRNLNLTRITELDEIVERHYAESLFLAMQLPPGPLSIVDIGSGAGFPGVPVAVARPESRITLVESHRRKAVFLKEVARGLPNIVVESTRAEDVVSRFDWVTSRAVAWNEIMAVAFRLAPQVALLTSGEGIPGSGEAIQLPWGHGRFVRTVSRETIG